MLRNLAALLEYAPAETTGYMIAGFTVILVILALYLISLALRQRNLRRELTVFEENQPR